MIVIKSMSEWLAKGNDLHDMPCKAEDGRDQTPLPPHLIRFQKELGRLIDREEEEEEELLSRPKNTH